MPLFRHQNNTDLVVVVCEDVVKGDVLGDVGVADDETHVLWAVHAHLMPEYEQRLLIVVHGDGRLR